jgi:hypothetical protein
MKECKKCNNTGIFDDKFCSRCGTTLVDLPICKCGKSIGYWNKFCSICGTKNINYKK